MDDVEGRRHTTHGRECAAEKVMGKGPIRPQQAGQLPDAVSQLGGCSHLGWHGFMDEEEHRQTHARQSESHQECGRVSVSKGIDIQKVLSSPIGHSGCGGSRQRVSESEQSAAFGNGNDLGEQEVEDHSLDPEQEPEKEEEEPDGDDGVARVQKQTRQRDSQDLDSHAGTHPEPEAEDPLAVFDQAGTQKRGEEHPQELKGTGDPHHQFRAREHEHVGGNQGGGIDQPKACLPEKTVQKMRNIVATEIAVYLFVVALLGLGRIRSFLLWASFQGACLHSVLSPAMAPLELLVASDLRLTSFSLDLTCPTVGRKIHSRSWPGVCFFTDQNSRSRSGQYPVLSPDPMDPDGVFREPEYSMASHSETGKSDLAAVPLDWELGGKKTESEPEVPESVIELTESAREEVRRLMTEQDQAGLRLGIKGGGCSGLSYLLEFTEERDGDTVVEFDDFRVFLDRKSTIYLRGVTLDHQGGLDGRGFVFHNPQASNTCGCGESFSL